MKLAENDQAEALPPELAQLEQLASAADAQLAGVDQLAPGAPGAAAAAPEVDETKEVAAVLSLISFAAGKAMPPIAEVYDPPACQSIAEQYMRCAEAYGWTFHKHASSPIAGLIAAAAMPALLNIDKFQAHLAEKRAAAENEQRQASTTSPLPTIDRTQALA